ncbi:hypothetical protein [Aeromonas encheleia]
MPSGGSVKGAAGLEAVEERRIPADMVVDTYMGSDVIWRYAVGLSTEGEQGMVEGRGQTLWICVAGVEH